MSLQKIWNNQLNLYGLVLLSFYDLFEGTESSQISSKLSSFVFQRWTKVLWVWNYMRVSN